MERINSCSNLGLDMILNTGSVMHKQGKRAANNQFCLGIEHRIWEKMGKCPFQKNNPAFYPIFQTN